MRSVLYIGVAVLVSSVALNAGVSKAQSNRLKEAAEVLREIHQTPDKDIPNDLWEKASCVAVIPGVKKVAFVLGGAAKSFTETIIVLLAVPFSLVGAIWLLWALGYNTSVPVWIGVIALAVFPILLGRDDGPEAHDRAGDEQAENQVAYSASRPATPCANHPRPMARRN